MNEREQLRQALEHCLNWLPDDCAEACEARAALSTPQADKVPAAEGASREPSDADYRRWAGSSGAHLREDYDQSTPYAIFHNATQWMNFCETVRSVHRELATPPAKLPQEAQPVAQWQKRHPARTDGEWENTHQADAKWWRDNAMGWEIRALYAAPQPARTGVVSGGELGLIETHPNYVAGFKAGHAAGKARAGAVELTDAAAHVLAERQRQIGMGWTTEHDDEHRGGDIARAAAAYCLLGEWAPNKGIPHPMHQTRWHDFNILNAIWPSNWVHPTPKDKRTNLVRAGALILAEIERMDRAAATTAATGGKEPS